MKDGKQAEAEEASKSKEESSQEIHLGEQKQKSIRLKF